MAISSRWWAASRWGAERTWMEDLEKNEQFSDADVNPMAHDAIAVYPERTMCSGFSLLQNWLSRAACKSDKVSFKFLDVPASFCPASGPRVSGLWMPIFDAISAPFSCFSNNIFISACETAPIGLLQLSTCSNSSANRMHTPLLPPSHPF